MYDYFLYDYLFAETFLVNLIITATLVSNSLGVSTRWTTLG